MIVHDFDLICPFFCPDKADTIFLVDPNAILPCPIVLQHLKSITWRHAQRTKRYRGIDQIKLATSD